ncbi:hypothetical protein AWB76_01606 [Caballeronia temeraria]|uniref:Uncharacterized protein n=1 Tax=Caballeronia temeraria TaxID=1777137 RepID=A0A158A2D5_9BURK|nr:hypothetical protein AWB76_01606 [Caballeronia temeraria]
MTQHLPHRQTAHDRVAELAARDARADRRQVRADSIDDGRAGNQRFELGELIGGRAPREPAGLLAFVKAARHFLQAENVKVMQRFGFRDDTRQIDAAIRAASPLNVPVDESHVHPRR